MLVAALVMESMCLMEMREHKVALPLLLLGQQTEERAAVVDLELPQMAALELL